MYVCMYATDRMISIASSLYLAVYSHDRKDYQAKVRSTSFMGLFYACDFSCTPWSEFDPEVVVQGAPFFIALTKNGFEALGPVFAMSPFDVKTMWLLFIVCLKGFLSFFAALAPFLFAVGYQKKNLWENVARMEVETTNTETETIEQTEVELEHQ